jgi:hypothetical protein
MILAAVIVDDGSSDSHTRQLPQMDGRLPHYMRVRVPLPAVGQPWRPTFSLQYLASAFEAGPFCQMAVDAFLPALMSR